MRVRGLVVASTCLLAVGCSDDPVDPVDLDGVARIGTTGSGAEVYAARTGRDRMDVRVLVDGSVRCNASGPSNAPGTGLCSDSSPDGSIHVATVDKGDAVPSMCDQQTGTGFAIDRVDTPASWGFDLVVGLTSEQDVFLAPS